MLLQTFPHARGFLGIGHHAMRLVGKQRQLLSLGQQILWLLVEKETVEHSGQQSVEGIIEYVDLHLF